jgi:hypothetical protein
MKIKTAELTEAALNWVVASIEWPNDSGILNPRLVNKESVNEEYGFHCDGTLSIHIFEREQISLRAPKPYWPHWTACVYVLQSGVGMVDNQTMSGPTMLVAGLRCHIANKLGDEVEVPDHLL